MNDATARAPWHLWLVGVLGLLWSSMGVLDFVLTLARNESYLAEFSPEQLEYFFGLPTWVIPCWGVAVFGGAVGSLLMLFRSKLAVVALGASLTGFLATVIQNYGLSNALQIMGTESAIFSGVIFVVSVFLLIYSAAMQRAEVLR